MNKRLLFLFIAIISIVARAQDNAADMLIKGNELYDKKLYTEAVAYFQKAADKGLAEAQYLLGYAYYVGEGVERNYTTAVMWYKRAAVQGFIKAEYNLAYCYMNGHGVPVDYTKAQAYLISSGINGVKIAQEVLYEYYENGILFEQDKAEAKRWKALLEGKSFDEAAMAKTMYMDSLNSANKEQLMVAENISNAQSTDYYIVLKEDSLKNEKSSLEANVLKQDEKSEELQGSDKELETNYSVSNDGDVFSDGLVFDIQLDDSKPLVERKQSMNEKPNDVAIINKDPEANPIPAEQKLLDYSLKSKHETDSLPKKRGAYVLTADGVLKEMKPIEDNGSPKSSDTTQLLANADTINSQQPTSTSTIKTVGAMPELKILYPQTDASFNTDVVKVKYQLITHGFEGVTDVHVLVDGKKVPTSRAVRQANMIEVDVPKKDCTIMMYAQNACGNSVPVSISLKRENISDYDLPRLFVVAIGVGEYNNEKLPNLKLACKDAKDFADVVETKKGVPFSDVQVKLLRDAEATRADIYEAMQWMGEQASPNDLCIFYFAGHGYRDEKDRFYFMPYLGNIDKLYEAVSADEFRTMVEAVKSKLIVFADACYSGGLLGSTRSAAAAHFVEQLHSTKNGMFLYASSESDTKSKEDPAWGNGAFTKALVEAFKGKARREMEDGLSTRRLDSYLYDEVRKLTNYKQTPILRNPDGMQHFNIFMYE